MQTTDLRERNNLACRRRLAVQAVWRILPTTNSRRITPSLCLDLISERDSQLRALFGNVTKPFADIPVDELIGGLQ